MWIWRLYTPQEERTKVGIMAAKNMEEIAALLKELRFQKKIFGGVDERDVWKKLQLLQKEYRIAFEAQEERSKALLQDREKEIAHLKKQLRNNDMTKQVLGDLNG